MHDLTHRLGPADDTSIEKIGVRRDGEMLTAQARFLYWKCGCSLCEPLPNPYGLEPSATFCDRHRSIGSPRRRGSVRGEIQM